MTETRYTAPVPNWLDRAQMKPQIFGGRHEEGGGPIEMKKGLDELFMQEYLALHELKRFLEDGDPVREILLVRPWKRIGAELTEEISAQIKKILLENCVLEIEGLRREIAGIMEGATRGESDAEKERRGDAGRETEITGGSARIIIPAGVVSKTNEVWMRRSAPTGKRTQGQEKNGKGGDNTKRQTDGAHTGAPLRGDKDTEKKELKQRTRASDICIDCGERSRHMTAGGKQIERCLECNNKKQKEYQDRYKARKKKLME